MARSKRHDGRTASQMRTANITPGFVANAAGSCLMEMGNTQVICTASFVNELPPWRKQSQLGWVTAEYGMLPASTSTRKRRPTGKPDGRGVEIQRLIGRVLRSVVDFKKLGANTVYLDCDVLQADGGTRTASITGAYVALAIAINKAANDGLCSRRALTTQVAGVSVGIVDGQAVLDLDYVEDSAADVDMNIAMQPRGKFVEVQGTSEQTPFDADQLQQMLALAKRGIAKLSSLQKQAIKEGG